MRATGYVRSVDVAGRLVIPKFLRRMYGFGAGERVEISSDGNRITIKRLCGKEDRGEKDIA